MIEYILRRIMLMLPTLLGISIVVFFIVQMVPGGPVEQAIQRMRGAGAGGGGAFAGTNAGMTQEAIAQLKAFYGFDKPIHIRYLRWLGNVLRLDLGRSYNYRLPVWDLIASRVPISLLFGGTGFLLAYAVCIPLGVYKAIHHRTWRDSVTSVLVFAGYSIPEFALGMLLLVLFGGGSFWNVFPLSGLTSDNFAAMSSLNKLLDVLHHMVLPLLCYMVSSFAVLTVMMKNSLMENLRADYVRTALAKGLDFRAALYKHALRNSLIPIATGFGAIMTVFISGSILIEVVFSIRGMGLLNYEALLQRDYPVTLGIIMVGSVLSLLGNLLSDILYVLIDPRIGFSSLES
ncbi:MAG: ABC transporter permease subunit [Candidatus Schekmanbacteria bacterium]|nr:ABC transporter permease subunit [Candidatus Schekmanbacteria bacterium]